MKILILYTRLTEYWFSCMQYSREHYDNEFLVFRAKPSPEAPFQINSEQGIEVLVQEEFTQTEFQGRVEKFAPSLIYVAGWTNTTYLQLAKHYKKKGVPVVVGMDNHWKGTLKQRLAGLFSFWYIQPYFTDIWIPGSPQYTFARQLGFKDKHIHKGLYCADASLFKAEVKPKKRNELLFVGRLVDHKGVPQLFRLLEQLIVDNQLHLDVHFVGNGPLAKDIPKHQHIRYTPFVAPKDLPALFQNTGFFILPSTYEAWGVVVHEALLSGTPVISTYQCGAATDLVTHQNNGFLFDAEAFDELLDIFETIQQMTDEQYKSMSKLARASAEQITAEDWSQTLETIGKH